MNSLASANGPSVTLSWPPASWTRAPAALWREAGVVDQRAGRGGLLAELHDRLHQRGWRWVELLGPLSRTM